MIEHKRGRGRPKTITEASEQRVIELHKDGMSIRAIHQATGMSRGSVHRVVVRHSTSKDGD